MVDRGEFTRDDIAINMFQAVPPGTTMTPTATSLLNALKALHEADFNAIVSALNASQYIPSKASLNQRIIEFVTWAKKEPDGFAIVVRTAEELGAPLTGLVVVPSIAATAASPLTPLLPTAGQTTVGSSFAFHVFLSNNSRNKSVARELKALLESRGLSIWFDDDQLPPGVPWMPLLEDGIRTSSSAAVLVGADGIGPWEDEEMQATLQLAVEEKRPVIPVLLPGAPASVRLPLFLRNRTWVDLRGGFTNDSLDRLLWGITQKKLHPIAVVQPSTPSATKTSGTHPTDLRGLLDPFLSIPKVPPNWVDRPAELEALKKLILVPAGGKVGVVSSQNVESVSIGVHGMGGIGKTALAIALAHDADVRARFSDGIYWITVGQVPDILALQAELASVVTGSSEIFAIVGEGKRRLATLLKGRSVLLIADDVWEADHVSCFDVLAAPGAMLVTTRNLGALTAQDIPTYPIGLLNDHQARQLLAAWAGIAVEEFPHAATIVAAECHGHALALKLAGAQVLHGSSWEDVAGALKEGKLDFVAQEGWGNIGGYTSVMKALDSSVQALPEAERRAYLDLACFPADEVIPASAAGFMWGMEERDARRRLVIYHGRTLLIYMGTQGFSFHDIQHDYLQAKTAAERSALHRRFLKGCTEEFGEDLGDLPKGSYFRRRHGWHGEQAARRVKIAGGAGTSDPPRTVDHRPFNPLKSTWPSETGKDEHGIWADLKINGSGQRMRWIAPGTFWMGSPETEPERRTNELRHRVTLSQGFWLANTLCSQELWEAVTGGKSPSHFKGRDLPVEEVSWNDCQEFLMRLPPPERGWVWALPTEAQWEYACRAGSESPYWTGGTIPTEQANFGKRFKKTTEVRYFPPNPWGLHDMHGNLWEWCRDRHGGYPPSESVDPSGPDSGGNRVVRGGSWDFSARLCRSACRIRVLLDYRSNGLGFRFAQVGAPEAK